MNGEEEKHNSSEKNESNLHKLNFYDIISSFKITKKKAFNKYLTELWKDLSLQSPDILKGISKEVFYSYFNYPQIINKHLFSLFSGKGKYLNLNQFIDGMNILYSNDFNTLVNFIFDFYDYDKDNIINKHDINLVLSYIQISPLIKNEIKEYIHFGKLTYAAKIEQQEEFFHLFNTFSQGDFELTREEFITIVKEKCSDIFLIPILFFYTQRPFNNTIINIYYEEGKELGQETENEINIILEPKYQEIINPFFRYKFAVPFLPDKNEKIIVNQYSSSVTSSTKLKEDIQKEQLKNEAQNKEKHSEKAPFFYMRKNYNKKDTLTRNKKMTQRRSTYFELFNLLQKEQTDYSGFMFKITKENNMKIYWFKLILNDLFYYKNRDDKVHIGMHHLSGVFMNKNNKKNFKGVELFSFSLIYPKKIRNFYLDKKENFDLWLAHLGKNINCLRVYNFYEFGEEISQTSFCTTYKGNPINSNSTVIIKKIDKKKTSKIDFKLIKTNLCILKYTQHPNIIKLLDIYEEEQFFYYVLQDYKEVDLFTFMEKANTKNEANTCEIIHQLLTAVYYLHFHGIIHRDLKPENIIATEVNGKVRIMLINFELSKIISGGEKATEPYGTLSYVAPEILLEKPYAMEVDLWSIGILTYLLLCGSLPFDDEHSEREIARQTIHDKIPFRNSIWDNFSPDAKDFVSGLLIKNPLHRLTIKEALVHNWIFRFFKSDVEKRRKCIEEKGFEFFNFSRYGEI